MPRGNGQCENVFYQNCIFEPEGTIPKVYRHNQACHLFLAKLKVALNFSITDSVYTNLIRNANLKGIKNECEDFWHFFSLLIGLDRIGFEQIVVQVVVQTIEYRILNTYKQGNFISPFDQQNLIKSLPTLEPTTDLEPKPVRPYPLHAHSPLTKPR